MHFENEFWRGDDLVPCFDLFACTGVNDADVGMFVEGIVALISQTLWLVMGKLCQPYN